MRLTVKDRRVLKELLKDDASTHEQIASRTGVPLKSVYKSVQRFKDAGQLELYRDGQRQIPRLALFAAVDRLEEATRELVEAAL